MELRLSDLAALDPLGVPLPNGTEVTIGRDAPPCPRASLEEDGEA